MPQVLKTERITTNIITKSAVMMRQQGSLTMGSAVNAVTYKAFPTAFNVSPFVHLTSLKGTIVNGYRVPRIVVGSFAAIAAGTPVYNAKVFMWSAYGSV